MIVVADASVVAEALTGGTHAGERLAEARLMAPHLIDVEFLSTVRGMLLTKRITPERGKDLVAEFNGLRCTRIPMLQFAARAMELRDNVSAYDAMYVALAEWLGVPLVTTDARLAGAPGIKATVEVVPVSTD